MILWVFRKYSIKIKELYLNNMSDIFKKAVGIPLEVTKNMTEIYEDEEFAVRENRKALQKIKNKKNVKTLEEQTKAAELKFKREQHLYESYDPSSFETKLRLDVLFYENLFDSLPEIDNLEEAVASFYRTVRHLYEMVNIKPKNHKDISTNLLLESVSVQGDKFKKIVMEHLNNYFYRLSPAKRKEKYFAESEGYATELIGMGVDPNEATVMAIKSCILESLIQNIAMPKQVRSRIKYLCEDRDYGLVFDQDKLKNLWEQFNQKSTQMARIVAVAV